MDEIIVGLYTFSLDSKAAAALLKHYGKHNVVLFFCKHGDKLPGNIPSNKFNKVKIISLGVNIEDYEDYDKVVIENDGYTSAAMTLYKMSQERNDFVQKISENNYIWIDMISRFHVRRDCMVAEDAYGFSLYLSMFNTYLSNSKPSYIWNKLITDESYVNYAISESYKLFLYKQQTFREFNKHIFSLEILGNKCLLINKRDMDSSVFLEYKGRSEYDFLICFQDTYVNRELEKNETNDMSLYLKEAKTKLVFTVYKNKDKSSIEFSELFGGKGHKGVSTFSLDHNYDAIGDMFVFNEDNDNLNQEYDFSDTVKKFIKSEFDNLCKTSIRIKHSKTEKDWVLFNCVPIPIVTNLFLEPYQRYQYKKEYIEKLLNEQLFAGKKGETIVINF